ncbi:MAG: hypothetical protein ACYCPT_07540 [Acidimicrobiales bacterium]
MASHYQIRDIPLQPPYDLMTVVFASDEPSAEVIAFYRDQCS